MNEENGIYSFPFRLSEDIAVCDAIKISCLKLDPGIRGSDLVDHL